MRTILVRAALATLGWQGFHFTAVADDVFPENFRRENLVAWCIVPFDAKGRGPEERAAMLSRLGLTRSAYDWRAEHVSQFEEEILQYQKRGIEYFAFWNEHPDAYRLFQQHKIQPQIWKTVRAPREGEVTARVQAAADAMEKTAEQTARAGLKLGLYNHGGWAGEPDNLVAICEALRARGHDHVGIVYNFHHAHFDLETFPEGFARMAPLLLCLNLNGMVDPSTHDVKQTKNKIRPIGSGTLEAGLLRTVLESGYEGPVGILGHLKDRDVEVVLRENLEGLETIMQTIVSGDVRTDSQ